MKRQILALFALLSLCISTYAQVEGTPYYLPKTEMHIRLLVEKTTYTPGEFAIYAERFLKKSVSPKPSVEYRVVGYSMYTTAIPDSSKAYFIPVDKKHTILNVERSSNGILMAINAKGKTYSIPADFVPSPKAVPVNPHDYMSEEILAAGSVAKMAELTAREIYDIRSSRSELSKGEADYMPKDGAQLNLMFANLDRQEAILLQTFQGVTVKDTIQHEICFVPEKKEGEQTTKSLLFRFSKKLGLVENDDFAGAPYYIAIEDLQIIPELKTAVDGEKRAKDDPGIMVNMPGKIKATILDGNKAVKAYDLYVAQFGTLESLSSNLFGKKMLTKIQLNPVAGNVELIETEPLD